VDAGADCYLLIPADEYRGPEPAQYTYEGREAHDRGKLFKLGPKVVLKATKARVEEWRKMLRTMYGHQHTQSLRKLKSPSTPLTWTM